MLNREPAPDEGETPTFETRIAGTAIEIRIAENAEAAE